MFLRSAFATSTESLKVFRTMMTPTATKFASNFVFDPPSLSYLPVVDSQSLFAVRRVYCVGKNYTEHIKEMGGDKPLSKPIFFPKPTIDGVVFAGKSGTPVKYPPNTDNFHYEVELVVAIGKEIKSNEFSSIENKGNVAAAILKCVYGYAVGIDLTRRDRQQEGKDAGLPWDLGKFFDQSAPIGPITATNSPFEHLDNKTLSLTVNGEIKQSVLLKQMIWNVPDIILELSKSYDLKPGDLIMTGTPKGVGPVTVGDRLIGSIDGGLVENVDIILT